MTPRTLHYLIFSVLFVLPKDAIVNSKFLAEQINKKIETKTFSSNAIVGQLRVLESGHFVEKRMYRYKDKDFNYWRVTDHGRSQYIPSEYFRKRAKAE